MCDSDGGGDESGRSRRDEEGEEAAFHGEAQIDPAETRGLQVLVWQRSVAAAKGGWRFPPSVWVVVVVCRPGRWYG